MHSTSSDIYRYFLFSVFFFCAGMHWVLKSVIMIQGYSFALDIFYLSVILKSHALVCLGVHGLAQIP